MSSGFYLVKSSLNSIAAISEIVSHAAASTLSEQPSFYDVLCCGRYNPDTLQQGKGQCAVGDAKWYVQPTFHPHDMVNVED